MEEIIVIRIIDSNENIFNSIMAALHDKSIKVMETSSSILSFGDVEIHPFSRCVVKAGKEVHLNHGEYSMLYCLAREPGRIFTKSQLYLAAWGEEQILGSNTVENTICRIRKKLGLAPPNPQYIKTIIGTGYKLIIEPT